MSVVLPFPQFDPVLVQIGPFAIRWYALAYIVSLVLGWRIMRGLVRLPPAVATVLQTDDFLTWATLGVVLGGRLGYILFYQPSPYFAHPLMMLAVWNGGMSFHGGMLGVTIALILFCYKNKIPLLGFADRLAIVTPMGLGLGRCANFINGELWGRPAPSSLPWAMTFPRADDHGTVPRHPSQLYEALMEGVILFAVMWTVSRNERLRARFGFLTGLFLAGYGVARSIGEFFREPDAFLGFLWAGATMGQLLCIPMMLAGLCLMLWAWRRASELPAMEATVEPSSPEAEPVPR